jgi:hypothetical protein
MPPRLVETGNDCEAQTPPSPLCLDSEAERHSPEGVTVGDTRRTDEAVGIPEPPRHDADSRQRKGVRRSAHVGTQGANQALTDNPEPPPLSTP